MLSGAIENIWRWLSQERAEPRGAPRRIEPEIVVHYWDGSAPREHHLRDISQTGAYILTAERWYPGTIVRLILQGNQIVVQPDGTAGPVASTCIAARVTRQGTDGVAVEFAFRNKAEERLFQKFLVAIPAQPAHPVVQL